MSALYRQVSDQILTQISKGERKVGDQLPPEVEFASELGVSRSTVRLAFNQLELIGVLRRRKRAGTQIIAAEPKTQYRIDTTGFEELVRFIRNMPSSVEQITSVSLEDIPELRKFEGESDRWLEVYASRTLPDGSWPICVSRTYVPERYSEIAASLHATGASVLTTIEKEYDVEIARIVQNSKAVNCPASVATLMSLEPGAAVVECQTEMYDKDGVLIEFAISHTESNYGTMLNDFSIT